MEFEFIHFPDFQNSFFGKEYCSSILETCMNVRRYLSCRNITYMAPKNSGTSAEAGNLYTVVSTLPADWVGTYSAKSYFDIDPLFNRPAWETSVNDDVQMSEIYQTAQTELDLQNFVNDMRSHRCGDHCIIVTHRGLDRVPVHVIFTFDGSQNRNGHASVNADEMIRLLRKELLQGVIDIHQTVVRSTGDYVVQRQEVQSLVVLTPREVDCLKWAARGKTDGEIAEILSIARWTVVTYLQNAKIKLGCANRTSAVAVAMSLGIIPLPDTSHLQG